MIEVRGSSVPRQNDRAVVVGKGETAEGFRPPEGRILGRHKIYDGLSLMWSAIDQ